MKTLLTITLMILSLAVTAQKKPVPADTARIVLTAQETAIIEKLRTNYTHLEAQLKRDIENVQAPYQQRMQMINEAYLDALRMRVLAAGGDATKWFNIKGDTLLYIVPPQPKKK